MKSFPSLSRALHFLLRGRFLRVCAIVALVSTAGWMVSVQGSLPSWIRNIEAGTAIEAAFFRAMSLPGGDVLFRRPPGETRPALGALITAQPKDADLYSLRALEDEQQLDFNAAEADWKKYVESTDAKLSAQITLADFYHRRVRPLDEIKALSVVANAPADASETLVNTTEQQSWRAFERIFTIIQDQSLGKEFSVNQYRAWLASLSATRNPSMSAFSSFWWRRRIMRPRANWSRIIKSNFRGDEIFPVKAKAMLEYQRGIAATGIGRVRAEFPAALGSGTGQKLF